MELIAEFLCVTNGSLELGVAYSSLFHVEIHGSLELGDFGTEILHHNGGLHWINIHRNVYHFVYINNRGKPAGVEGARVTVYINSASVFVAEAEMVRMNLDRRRRDEVAQSIGTLFERMLDFGGFHRLVLGGNIGSGVAFLFFLKHGCSHLPF